MKLKLFAIILTLTLLLILGETLEAGSVRSKESDLESYLKKIKTMDPYAVITGWFNDWRDVSVYRAKAGYHLGYDIGLLKDFPVPSGWKGVVTSIVPWSDKEWGITVLTPEGYFITFGHLCPFPSVKVGTIVEPGMTIGTIAVDHVDIKVTDGKGRYIDIGKTSGLLAIDPNVSFYFDPLTLNNSSINIESVAKAKQKELSMLTGSVKILNDYLKTETDILQETHKKARKSEKFYKDNLISKHEYDLNINKEKNQKEKVLNLKKRLDIQTGKIQELRSFLSKHGYKELPQNKSKKVIANSDQERLKKAENEMKKYQNLYYEGAVSKKEAENKELEYKRLKLEIMLKTEEN